MTEAIQQHLDALKAERERARRALQIAQQQANEISVHLLKLEGGIETCEALLGTETDGKAGLSDNRDGVPEEAPQCVSDSNTGPAGVCRPGP